jgi:hypothetical protein
MDRSKLSNEAKQPVGTQAKLTDLQKTIAYNRADEPGSELACGRPDQAVEHAREALAIHRETGHRLGEARTLRILGHAIRRTEGTDTALPHWHAALAILADAGATPEADALRDLLATAGDPLGSDR